MVVNYNNGKVYKIVCNISGLIYIGSTTKKHLSQRLDKHRSAYKSWKNDNTKPYTTSFKVFENDNFKIVLLEAVNCNTKNELTARERFYIESTDCVNKFIPLRSHKEYIQTNKESISEKKKIYYEANKVELIKKAEEYRDINRDEIKKSQKKHRDTNRDLINKKARDKRAAKKREYMELYPLLFPK